MRKGREKAKPAPVKSRRSFTRLLALECYPAVHQMMLSGYPLAHIVKFIQERKGEYDDIKSSSLLTLLYEHRKSLPTADILAPFIPRAVIAAQEEFDDQLQDLRDLTWAIDMLKENISALYQTVADTGFSSPSLQVELDTLSRMILRRHEIRMDMGIGGKGRNLGTLTVAPSLIRRVCDKHGMVFEEIIGDPEKLSQVVSGATRLLAAARDDGTIIEGELICGD